MSRDIIHKGIITKIEGDTATVRISPESEDCGGCAIASFCSKPLDIQVEMPGIPASAIGKRVDVEAYTTMHLAARLALVIAPVVMIVMVLVACSVLGLGELLSGVLALVVLPVWALFLYANRNKLRRDTRFTIKMD